MDINIKTRKDIAKEVIDEVKAREALEEAKNKQERNIDKKSKEEILEEIIKYAKTRCESHIEDEACSCEYCDGVFAVCRKILMIAGEDLDIYE